MKMFKKMKKGFTIIELIFVIILISVLSMGAFILLNKESSKAMTDNHISTATRTLMTALSEYKVKSANASYNFAGVNAEALKPFLDTTNTFTINGTLDASTISLKQNPNIVISLLPLNTSAANDSVKVMYNVSGLTAQGYSADQLSAVENAIARTYKDAYPNAKVTGGTGGNTIGAVNSKYADATANTVDSDGYVLVSGIQ